MGLLDKINQWDIEFISYVHQHHTPFWDDFMCFITEKYPWIPLYVIIIGYLLIKYKLKGLYIIASISGLVILSDYIASGISKPFFERLRPCHDSGIQHLLNSPCGCGAQYGFFSSHAANTFSLAGSMVMVFRKNKWIWLFMFWAAIISFSRVYTGVHYLSDIMMGGFTGTLWSVLYWYFMRDKLKV